MSIDFSQFTTAQRHIAHQAGRGDGDAQRDAAWIQIVLDILGSQVGGGLNQFPMTAYTPDGSGVVTSANFVASFNAALAAALAGGGRVVIPAGVFDLTAEFNVQANYAATPSQIVIIEGAGPTLTTLRWPNAYSGNGLHLAGSPPAPFPLHQGRISNLTLDGSGCSGKGLVLDAIVGFTFDQVYSTNWTGTGGAGLYCRDFVGGGYNSQDCLFLNCFFRDNYNGIDVQALTNGYFINTAISGTHNCALIDACRIGTYGCNFQGTPSNCGIEFGTAGGSYCDFNVSYFEGTYGPSFIKIPAQSSESLISVRRMTCPAGALFCDIQGTAAQVVLDQILDPKDTTVFVKARNANMPITVTVPNLDYASNPSKFDLDATSLTRFCYQNGGDLTLGSSMTVGTTVNLAGFPQGSEPTANNQAIVWNTTTGVPRVRSGGSWSDLVTNNSQVSLYELLAPYSVEIFDPGVVASLSSSITTPNGMVGLQHGTTLADGIVAQSPTVGASQVFRGQYGLTTTYDAGGTTAKWFKGTLATTVGAGLYPGLFVVFAPSTTSTSAGRRRPISITNGSEFMVVDFDDVDTGAHVMTVTYKTTVAQINSITTSTLRPHVLYAANNGSNMIYQFDGAVPGTAGPAPAALSGALTTVWLGGYHPDNTGGDVTVLFAAVLNQVIPAQVVDKAQKLAKALYGIL